MTKLYVGIDNGSSGSIGMVWDGGASFCHTPVFSELSYQKDAREFTRVNVPALMAILRTAAGLVPGPGARFAADFEAAAGWTPVPMHIVMERPMVNPGRFQATASGLRAYEATKVAIQLAVPHASTETIDSRTWQKQLLPAGIKGAAFQKKASLQRGSELFPAFAAAFREHGDADGLMLAEWARRNR